MRSIAYLFLFCILFISCWKVGNNIPDQIPDLYKKVWGSRPIYASIPKALTVLYTPQKQPIIQAGNIYAKGNYILQVDVGRGIHVIDNTIPSKADRIGFITINGCAQISMKDNYLYANSISDLVTLDVSNPTAIKEVSRIKNAFPEFQYNYPLVQPEEKGYYQCPKYDSIVIGWVKDSIYAGCYKY